MGLLHISQGEGSERHIVVSKQEKETSQAKPVNKSMKNGEAKPSNSQKMSENKTENKKKDTKILETKTVENVKTVEDEKSDKSNLVNEFDHMKCTVCQREVPKSNYDLHILRCKPPAVTVGDKTTQSHTKSAKPKKAKGKKNVTNNGLVKADEEDFDALIAAAVKDNTSCKIKKCKSNAATLGRNCPFCSLRCVYVFVHVASS